MNALLSARRVRRAWTPSAIFAVFAALLACATPRATLAADDENPVEITAKIVAASGDAPAKLEITAVIAPHYHTYSITQPKGKGPQPDVIKVEPSDKFTLGTFTASPEPKKEYDPNFKTEIEVHYDRVVWSAPLTPAAGVSLNDVVASGEVKYFVCRESNCQMGKQKFSAALAAGADAAPAATPKQEAPTPLRSGLDFGAAKPAADDVASAFAPPAPAPAPVATEYRAPNAKVAFTAQAFPARVRPGESVYVTVHALPDAGFHVYPLEPNDDVVGYKPTLLALTEVGGFRPGATTSTKPAEQHTTAAGDLKYYADGPVAWTVKLDVPADAAAGARELKGAVALMACSNEGCDAPVGAAFSVPVVVADATSAEPAAATFAATKYREVGKLLKAGAFNAGVGPIAVAAPPQPASTAAPSRGGDPAPVAATPIPAEGPITAPLQIKDVGGLALTGLPMILAAAFAGGFILNFMPCVLPVIGLKVMSFVSQAGESRLRVFLLNVAYTAGVLAVFMVLATLAAFLNYGWGEQFTNKNFTITLAALIWLMALSFIGVWELPIPGMGGGGGHNLARKEGYLGGFFKGVMATLLATPCSGPFVGSVLGATLTMTPGEIYLVFAAVGLGMASPYLVIGLFPSLVGFLPKPGEWMDTFKQAMGFFLMGGVIFLLNSLPHDYLVPTFTLLIGLWAAAWWIGKVEPTADFATTSRAWMVSGAVVLLTVAGAFGLLAPGKELPWEPFSKATLAKYQAEGKTVLVDFTADWCTNCKALEKFVLNTAPTERVVLANNVKVLVADMTEEAPESEELLEALGSRSIPVTAIFPAGRPNEPIVLRDIYTRATLLEALDEAGPSKTAPAVAGGSASETAQSAPASDASVMR